MKKLLTIALIVQLTALVLPAVLCAQVPGLPDPGEQEMPIGGLTVLAVLGGGYAVKKLHDKSKT